MAHLTSTELLERVRKGGPLGAIRKIVHLTVNEIYLVKNPAHGRSWLCVKSAEPAGQASPIKETNTMNTLSESKEQVWASIVAKGRDLVQKTAGAMTLEQANNVVLKSAWGAARYDDYNRAESTPVVAKAAVTKRDEVWARMQKSALEYTVARGIWKSDEQAMSVWLATPDGAAAYEQY